MNQENDDPPPCIGERYRDTLHDIYRAAQPPETEEDDDERRHE